MPKCTDETVEFGRGGSRVVEAVFDCGGIVRDGGVLYFPSYEVITSPAAGGRYYADDLRQVTDLGVRHVMRLFTRHFIDGEPAGTPDRAAAPATLPAAVPSADVVCDEETIERSLREGGFR